MKKFYIYEVKGIKNGCTIDWDKRCEQNLKKYNIIPVVVETYEYPNTAEYWQIVGDREWELAELNGYPKGIHYRVAMERRISGSKLGGTIGGKINGRLSVESGHWASICSMGGKVQGLIQGKKNVESGHMAIMIKNSIEARRKPILQYHKNGTFIKEWDSIVEAGNELNLDRGSITKVCKGKLKTCGGFVFKYKSFNVC